MLLGAPAKQRDRGFQRLVSLQSLDYAK
jgi:hypothetical protein